MEQIVDLQNDAAFNEMGVALLSIAFDDAASQAAEGARLGITVPLLVDEAHEVAEAYDVLQWAVRSGEPSHTFVLVDEDGKIVWVRDYGSPDKSDAVMYVAVDELNAQIADNLE
jgi:peroxiredoxin